MLQYDRKRRFLAIGLTLLAGYIDAVGFLSLGGLFVSFMSGNSTRLAVDAVALSSPALAAAMLIACFVIGVMAGAMVGRLAVDRRKPAVLLLVTLLLTSGAILTLVSANALVAAIPMACAMGAANNVFQRAGEVSVGVTYMTGTLVKFGQHLMAAISGGPRAHWLPYLLLWLGLVSGGIIGATVHSLVQLGALWPAAAFSGLLATYAARHASSGPVCSK